MIETISNSYETLINELDNHTSNNFKETYNKVALTPPMGWSSWNSLKLYAFLIKLLLLKILKILK